MRKHHFHKDILKIEIRAMYCPKTRFRQTMSQLERVLFINEILFQNPTESTLNNKLRPLDLLRITG